MRLATILRATEPLLMRLAGAVPVRGSWPETKVFYSNVLNAMFGQLADSIWLAGLDGLSRTFCRAAGVAKQAQIVLLWRTSTAWKGVDIAFNDSRHGDPGRGAACSLCTLAPRSGSVAGHRARLPRRKLAATPCLRSSSNWDLRLRAANGTVNTAFNMQ